MSVDLVAQRKPGGGFFAIDRRIWKVLCGFNGHDVINMAVAYLTIAVGTGGNNRISRWSAKAIEVNTGLHASRATAAIKALISAHMLKTGKGWSRTRPVYELMPFKAVRDAARLRLANQPLVEIVMNQVCKGKEMSQGNSKILDQLVLAGLFWKSKGEYLSEPPEDESHGHLIWLPNTLVTGTSIGEQSPIRRLRSRGDVWALRLLIDLYHSHNLSADGGISRLVLRDDYERQRYGERGQHVVWGFSRQLDHSHAFRAQGHPSVDAFWEDATIATGKHDSSKNKIWEAIGVLKQMGLITAIPHLVENSSPTSEPMHGFGILGVGEPIEQEIAAAAIQAGIHIIGEKRLYTAETVDGVDALVPVWDTQPDVQMVGIYRLTYRPQTRLTADWYRKMSENAQSWLDDYRHLGPPAKSTLPRVSGEPW
jgi:hypothetical protein